MADHLVLPSLQVPGYPYSFDAAATARLGDAWYPIGSNNRHLLDTLPRHQAGIDRLRRLTTEAGRDTASSR